MSDNSSPADVRAKPGRVARFRGLLKRRGGRFPVILLLLGWFTDESARFQGPPLTPEAVAARQAEIAREEAALGGVG